eukprot:TRINITY_DN9300_c2_g1_i1.p4 TRINITY_DN9300_c2_g1~~TRINITY_DN9300_c2_g1_i1.p4  ORF type:complete len:115 (-),score=14.76 TRINITY_DN9300_c2_g1_i1:449-793(-)
MATILICNKCGLEGASCPCRACSAACRVLVCFQTVTPLPHAMLLLWKAGEHACAVEMLILCLVRCSPNAELARIRRDLMFNVDGTLRFWNLQGCGLPALPEEFGMVRTTGPRFV